MLIAASIFIILGILIKYGKMYFLIAGYNTMDPEEKANYNIERIATLFRNVMFGMAAIIFIGYLFSKWLEIPNFELYSFYAAILIGIPYLLIQANSKKYKSPHKKNK